MKSKLNIGIIGTSRMGSMYGNIVSNLIDKTHLYAAHDIDKKALDSFAERFCVDHKCYKLDEFLSLPALDAVIISAITQAHHELVVAVARQGKPIFCEKPMGLSVTEIKSTLEVTQMLGAFLQVGFMRRFDTGYAKAKQIIETGEIGEPITVKSLSRDPKCPDADSAFSDPSQTGGLILDLGIHDIDLVRWFIGAEVSRISAETCLKVCTRLKETGDDDNAMINLRFENDCLGHIESSWHSHYGYDIRTEILGSNGGLQVGVYQHTPVIKLNRHGVTHDMKPYFVERFGDAYCEQIRVFVDALQRDKPAPVTGEDALAAMEIAEGARYSARTGMPVSIQQAREGLPRQEPTDGVA